jgi:hypothetical protein
MAKHFYFPYYRAISNAGAPLANAKLNFFLTGTSTAATVYADLARTTPLSDPVVADTDGKFPPIFVDPDVVYRVRLTDSANVQQWQEDAVPLQLFPQSEAESLAQVTPVNYAYAPGSVMRYGADSTGVVDSTDAVRQALLASTHVHFPPGAFLISETIEISGNKSIIGDRSGTPYGQATAIYFTGSGNLFRADTGGFGYLYIGHFQILGGSGDGAPCIYINRPQSITEYITMESGTGYNNPGIQIQNVGLATTSFSTTVRCCKWVGPFTVELNEENVPVVVPTPCDFTGYSVEINGGHVLLEELVPIFGNIGIHVLQGQAVDIIRPNPNRQYEASSTESAADGQCGIRLSGSLSLSPDVPPVPVNYKAAVSIRHGYIEACTNGIYIASCESCSIEDNIIQDVGFGAKPGISLPNGDAQNVTIKNNQISQANAGIAAIFNGSENNVLILNNWVDAYGGAGAMWLTVNARTDIGWNSVINGVLDDPAEYVFDLKEEAGTWTPGIEGSATPGAQTYTLQFGRYRKVGRRVDFDFSVILSTKGPTIAGNLLVTGLPYTSRSDASGRIYNVAIGGYSNINLSAGKTQVSATVSNNATNIVLIENGDNVALAALTAAALQNSTAIYGSGSYEV